MKKLLLISMLIGAMPLAMMAQDDDLYFVPKKKDKKVTKIEVVTDDKVQSSYEEIVGDSTKMDIIDFSETKGVYPDSVLSEDYKYTKRMTRFDDYDLSDNEAFWAGYRAGASTWAWHSPWYYNRYGYSWYDPWYFGPSWYYGPSWYSAWYDPWYMSPYGWYDPWYYSWYGWGYPYYYGYYGWGYPYYYYGGGGSGHYYGHTGNSGTIDRRGSSHGSYYSGRGPVAGNSQRMGSLRDRAASMGGGRVYTSGNSERSRSGNFSGRRGGDSGYSNSTNSSRSNYGSYSGNSNTRSSSSGSFSSGGGSRNSGGGSSGGGRSGGGSLGGRR